MRSFRILQIFNTYVEYGGEEGAFHRITETLRKEHAVETFITSSNSLRGPLSKQIAAPLLTLRNPFVTRELQRLQTEKKFDFWIIHNVFPTMSPEVYRLAFDLGVPVVQYLHNYRLSCANGFFLNHGTPCTSCIDGNFSKALRTACWKGSHLQSGWMGIVLKRVRRLKVFEKVSAWVAISEAQKQLHVRMGIPEDRIRVVPHFYESTPPAVSAPGSNAVLFIGRLSLEKGVHVLLEAWAQVQTPNAQLLIAGDGPERRNLETMSETLRLKNVRFTGFVPPNQQVEIWEACSVTVVPSIWSEPFGLVVLEAWSRGKVPIVSRIGGLQDIVRDDTTGIIVPPGDAAALAKAIDQLFADPERRQRLASEGARDLDARYSEARWMTEIQSIFESLPIALNHQLIPGPALCSHEND